MKTDDVNEQYDPGLYEVRFGGRELFWVRIAEDGTATAGKGQQEANVVYDVDGWIYVNGDGIDACVNILPDLLHPDVINAKWITLWENGTPKPQTGFAVGGNPNSMTLFTMQTAE